ncbi:hypothetical protein P7C70_g6049, partial [Phenoliferia sp. Uapishka_3]
MIFRNFNFWTLLTLIFPLPTLKFARTLSAHRGVNDFIIMATIHSLPPEIIITVLQGLVSTTPHYQCEHRPAIESRGIFQPSDLLATSLVCSWFRVPSQALLSTYIDFTHPFQSHTTLSDGQYFREQFRARPLGKWLAAHSSASAPRVNRLRITGPFVSIVLDKLTGLRELEILGRVQGPWEWSFKLKWEMCSVGFRNEAGWELLSHPTLRSQSRSHPLERHDSQLSLSNRPDTTRYPGIRLAKNTSTHYSAPRVPPRTPYAPYPWKPSA